MPRASVSGIPILILPEAVQPRNVLDQLIHLQSDEIDTANLTTYNLDHLLSIEPLDREERLLDINIQKMHKLHRLALTILRLPTSYASLTTVPLLLEALYLNYITAPINPRYHSEYALSTAAHLNLVLLTADAPQPIASTPSGSLTTLIANTPIPEIPILQKDPPKRRAEITMRLHSHTIDKLYTIGNLILTRSNTDRRDALALDWILRNIDTKSTPHLHSLETTTPTPATAPAIPPTTGDTNA